MGKYVTYIVLHFFFITNAFSQKYADEVLFGMLGGPNNFSADLKAILYSPEYPQWNKNTILSLGGGCLVIDLGVYAINGDGPDLKIYEVGTSYGLDDEPFWMLGNSDNNSTDWKYLGRYPGDICYLDFDSLGVTNIRYLAIIDAVPNTDLGPHPGADFDAVEILNYNATKLESKDGTVAESFRLYQNYPNPFNANTTIKYDIASSASITLQIFDSSGKKIKTLLDHVYQTAGQHAIIWDGSDNTGNAVASGTYYCSLQGDDGKMSCRMILTK